MLAVMLVAAALLSLSVGHWLGGGEASWGTGGVGGGVGGDWRSRQAGGYCRDNQGYLYRCGDSNWGSGSRWNNYYGSGGYYERARYVGRGRVRYRGRYNDGAELICDFRRDGRLGSGDRVENVVWKRVRDSYNNGGYYGSGGSYSGGGSFSGGSYSGCGGSGGCGGGYNRDVDRHYPGGGSYPSGVVAGWVTTSRDVSTLTLSDPRPNDAGRYRCYAQVRGRSSYGRGDMVYMEVDYRGSSGGGGGWGSGSGSSSWGSGGWGSGSGSSGWGSAGWGSSGGGNGWGSGGWGNGGWGSGGWGNGGSGGWGGWGYRRSALSKTEPDRVVDEDAAETKTESTEGQQA